MLDLPITQEQSLEWPDCPVRHDSDPVLILNHDPLAG